MRDEDDKSKRYIYLLFENKQDTEKCLRELCCLTFKGKQIFDAIQVMMKNNEDKWKPKSQ